jgi:hypothetical protein
MCEFGFGFRQKTDFGSKLFPFFSRLGIRASVLSSIWAMEPSRWGAQRFKRFCSSSRGSADGHIEPMLKRMLGRRANFFEGEKEPVSDLTFKKKKTIAGLGLKIWSESGKLSPSKPRFVSAQDG